MARALVTGATGLLGANLVRVLLSAGDKVRVTVRRTSSQAALNGLEIEKVEADVRDRKALARALDGIEAVYHCAAVWKTALGRGEAEAMLAVNIEGTRNIVEEARTAGVRRVVHVSSTAVFRPHARPGLIEETFPYQDPRLHPYTRSKIESERIVLDRNGEEIETVVVNPGGMLGEHDYYRNPTYATLISALKGRVPVVFDGIVPLILADDAARAMKQAMDQGRPGERYLLVAVNASLEQICTATSRFAGSGISYRTIPVALAKATALANQKAWELLGRKPDLVPYDIEITQCHPGYSSDKAKKELGFSPAGFDEIIRRSVKWLKDRGWNH